MGDDTSETSPDSSPQAPSKSDKTNSDISPWIKNTAAMVGVFAALAGIWVSVHQLRQKADTDLAAATATELAEAHKVEVAKLQIDDQREARKEQRDLELEKLRMEIKQKSDVIADADKINNRQTLSQIITRIFTSSGSDEGDMASLFGYLGSNQENFEIVTNAVLARLENPASAEEVDLGFKLLESIGAPALETAVDANRAARRKYDDYILSRFYLLRDARAKLPASSPRSAYLDQQEAIEIETAKDTNLDRSYVYALINQRVESYGDHGSPPIQGEKDVRYMRFLMAMAVIERSNIAFARMLPNPPSSNRGLVVVDFDKTYLQSSLLGSKQLTNRKLYVRAVGAFVGLDDFGTASIPEQAVVSQLHIIMITRDNPNATKVTFMRASSNND